MQARSIAFKKGGGRHVQKILKRKFKKTTICLNLENPSPVGNDMLM